MEEIETKKVRTGGKYNQETKVSVARKVVEEKASQSELARQMNIPARSIHAWVYQARHGKLAGYRGPAFDEKTGDLVAEVKRLHRDLTRVTQERDFLKRAAAFFAKEAVWNLR